MTATTESSDYSAQNFTPYFVESKTNSSNSISTADRPNDLIVILCYSVIIVVSLCGNVIVCKVAFTRKDMRTTTNMLIASLACSDILMTSFNIPFNVARILLYNWPFGPVLCFLVPFITTSCVYVSTFTMTVIAMHRLWTVTQRRTTHIFSAAKILLTVFAIWTVASTLSIPHAMFQRLKQVKVEDQDVIRCRIDYPLIIKQNLETFNFPLFLSLEVLITQYLLPLSITMVVYIKIGFIISKQGKLIGKLSDERKRRQSEAKRRRILMLALAVATFAVCWFPINLYFLLVDFKIIKHHTVVFLICHWFAMSSVCYNPFIYCWLNEKFRNGAKETIASISRCNATVLGRHSPPRTLGVSQAQHTEVTVALNHDTG